ncbi:MAG: von Willebrand factor type A domain-containing protein [Gemmatimonas sp.]|nr:von Willebrand factor type A domain-containing protein [Gemmatimonas sp.]MCZ8203114.1 von Willebrand factor type A domain-containing protein [Gemmatimonas sp.]
MSRDEFMVSDERLLPVFDDAGHVDEGTVHAWLDEAFDDAAAALVAAHVAQCAHCADQVAEARGFSAASSRVLAALDAPAATPAMVTAHAAAARRTAPSLRPQWWWKAAAGLFVVLGGTVLLRRSEGNRRPPEARTAVARTAEARTAEAVPAASDAAASKPGAARGTSAPSTSAPRASVVNVPAAPAAEARVAAVRASAPPATEGAPPALPARLASADASPVANITVTVAGMVSDAASAQPIANAQVWVRLPNGDTRQTQTNAVGGYALPTFEVARGARIEYGVRAFGFRAVSGQFAADSAQNTLHVKLTYAAVALNRIVTGVPAPMPQPRAMATASAAVLDGPASKRLPAAAPAPSPSMAVHERAARRVGDLSAGPIGTGRTERDAFNREQYDRIEDNPFLGVRTNPLSTFSIDVDRASYGNVRRFLTSGQRPPKDAVRIEELINYFPYELPEPRGSDPVAITSEVMTAPWQPQHRLVRIGLQARRIETASLPPNNLVFLVDVSGSMNEWNKLPLVKQSLRLLVNALRPQDRVAIVAYAGAAGLVLPSTSGDEKARIADAIDRLEAGGSTAGGAGIELAYRTAREHFLERGNNRVILATDGDFNVGVSSDAELERLVEQRRRDGTYLTVLGFGTGNYQAAKMEKLAKVGNGNAGYVDSPAEARKLLVEEMGATLLTVANDVKLQVEFNPSRVQAYRLIGYENRLLSTEDFNDDAKDAGDIGTGHQVTALYEVVPVGVDGTVPVRGMDSLRYVAPDATVRSTTRGPSDELLFVKLRYKRPGNSASQLLSHAVPSRISARPSTDARFIAAVASFGMLLRDSEYKGNSSAAQVLEQARAALGEDRGGYRAEFVGLVERWRALGVTAGERR